VRFGDPDQTMTYHPFELLNFRRVTFDVAEDVARLSPLVHNHVNMFGRDTFTPLRDPGAVIDRPVVALCANDVAEQRRSTRGGCEPALSAGSEPAATVEGDLLALVAEESARSREHPRVAPSRIRVDARHDAVDSPHLREAVGGDVAQVLGA
jgi:hypothetical protein